MAHILEEMGLETVGTHGTVAALALLNDAVKKGGLMACSHVGGLSGSFIPISEDIGMIESAAAGQITLDKLEAMTASFLLRRPGHGSRSRRTPPPRPSRP